MWTTPLLADTRFSNLPPAIADGRVYLSDEKHFYALDVQSGELASGDWTAIPGAPLSTIFPEQSSPQVRECTW